MKTVPIDAPAVAHGLGLFETMLVIGGVAVQRDAHFARLAASAAALHFPPPDSDVFVREVDRAAAACAGEAALRCVYVDAVPWTLAVTVREVPYVTVARRTEGRVITLDRSFARSLPEHKLTSYAVCVLGLQRALEARADEALFVDEEDHVFEGTATNIFALCGDTLITAPERVLPGIVRAWVLEQAERIEWRAPSVDELRAGSFMTGSLTGIAPIRSVNGIACETPGPWFDELTSRARRLRLPVPPRRLASS